MSEETTNEPVSSPRRKGSSLGKLFWFILVVIIIVGGYLLISKETKAVAIVNGETITQAQYDKKFAQIQKFVESQGQTATSTEMQGLIGKQAMQDLVTETLLLQKAKEEGITINDDSVNIQLKETKAQFPDDQAYQKALSDQGYTETTFRETLRMQNLIQQYLDRKIDMKMVTTTQSEIKQLYNDTTSAGGQIPPFDEVKGQIEAQILKQKQQNLIGAYLQKLTASSTIEILNEK